MFIISTHGNSLGAVGIEMINTLYKRKFPLSKLRLFASERSAGKTLNTVYGDIIVEVFDLAAVKETDICLMAVSGDFSLQWAKQICTSDGAIVIDNRFAFVFIKMF